MTIKEVSAYAAPADYTPVVTTENKTVHRGQTFTIGIDLSDNEGLIALCLELDFRRDVISLVNVERGDALADLTYTNTNSETSAGYNIQRFRMLWDGKVSTDTNGNLVTLTFDSFSDAPIGTYPITLSYDANNTNREYNAPIAVTVVSGSVTITTGEFEAVYYDWDDTELYRKDYNSDQTAEYVGETPFREEDECYSYRFNGWKGIASEEQNVLKYRADYILTPKEYQIMYYADGYMDDSFDGIVDKNDRWKAEILDYGTFLENDYPTKTNYLFSGWFIDEKCTKPFTESHMPAHDVELYGYFVFDIRTTSIPKIQLSSVSYEEDVVVIEADMVVNTGFNGMVLTLSYDRDALEFIGFEQGEIFEALQFTTTNTQNGLDVENFKFYYEHSENTFETGVFLKMRFRKKESASSAGLYEVTFTMDNRDATYINGKSGIRYTEIEIIGTQVPIGKLYRWEKSAEDSAEITVSSESGLPADTALRVSLVSESEHKIDSRAVAATAGRNMEIKAVYDLRLMRIMGDTVVEIAPDGMMTVEIKLTDEQLKSEDLLLYYVDDDGNLVAHEYERIGDAVRFQTDRLDRWAIVGDIPTAGGKLSDAAVMLISMPILLAIATMGYTLIILGKNKKKKEKEKMTDD